MLLSICTQKFTRTQTNLKALLWRWRRWLILIHLVNIQNRGQRGKWFQKKISEFIFAQARVNDILSFSYHFFSLVWPILAQSIHICAQCLNKILNLTKFHSCFRAIVSQKAIMFQTSCRKKRILTASVKTRIIGIITYIVIHNFENIWASLWCFKCNFLIGRIAFRFSSIPFGFTLFPLTYLRKVAWIRCGRFWMSSSSN